jgi:hypothetical protein
VIGGWRTLHNEELHNVYSSPYIIRMIKSRRMRWAGHVALTREKLSANRRFGGTYRLHLQSRRNKLSKKPASKQVGKPEGKRPLGRPRRRWEDNIKMDLRDIG